ncbi:hypothetical protein GCM10027436_78610 [Actinophytocola sediminis]
MVRNGWVSVPWLASSPSVATINTWPASTAGNAPEALVPLHNSVPASNAVPTINERGLVRIIRHSERRQSYMELQVICQPG